MIQYPTSKGYVQGYVTNATNIIKYKNQYNWKNGSTQEPVKGNDWQVIGALAPGEEATLLYTYKFSSTETLYCLAYDTDKGKHTKSGYVEYEGINGSINNVNPGELVGPEPTYPTNATVVKDFLYLRDEKGNLIPGRQVDVGDRMTVLDVSYSRQLALVQYPTSQGYRQGYVTNVPELINYDNKFKWCNGSTSEPVLFEDGKEGLGSLSPYERATILYKHKNGMYHVVYGTDKGPNSKSGYVKYDGTSTPKPVTLPTVSEANVTKIRYGTSEMGNPLEMYKIGNGNKILFAGFGIHGFEDEWFRDGIGLAHIANELIKALAEQDRTSGLNGWTVYVSQCMNPDGLMYGWSHNGPGRCAVGSSVDMNRCFPTDFVAQHNGRNYTGSKALMAIEAQQLVKKLEELKSSKPSRMVVLDCHGWMNETLGDEHLGRHFCKEFGFCHRTTWGEGYFSNWAKNLCDEALLVEYPITKSLDDVYSKGLHIKTINAIKGIINTANTSNSEGKPVLKKGEVINISSYLNVRNEASHNANIIGSLSNGTKVDIVEENGEWYKINYNSGYGYVSREYIVIIEGEESIFNAGGIVTASVLNIREYATTKSSILGTLNKDSIVDIVAKISTWYKIRYNNSYGYVDKKYVDIYNQKPVENDQIIDLIKELEKEVIKFDSDIKGDIAKINDITMDIIRHIKYSGVAWFATLGSRSLNFLNYLLENNRTLYDSLYPYIRSDKSKLAIIRNIEIDLPHLIATTQGYIFSTTPHFWTGWGGDLATLMGDVTKNLIKDGEKDNGHKTWDKYLAENEEAKGKAYEYAHELLGGASSFSQLDIEADFDAIALSELCKNMLLSEALIRYYPPLKVTRKNSILKDITAIEESWNKPEQLKDIIYNKMHENYGSAPTLGLISLGKYRYIYTYTDDNGKLSQGTIYVEPREVVKRMCCLVFAEKIINM